MGAAVSRAALLAEADRWLAVRHPNAAARAKAQALVGHRIVVSCSGSAVASEVRILEEGLLGHLRGIFPGLRLDGLKCLVRGSRVSSDDEVPHE